MSTFYQLTATSSAGKQIDFNKFKGKTVLIVNTATQCGFTKQLLGLEQLHQKYKDKGLVVIGFPCNQFGGQEPLSNQEMQENCLVNYGVSFVLSQKVHVNGKNTHPVFTFLKKQALLPFFSKIKWNFTKFLISPDGQTIKRYSPLVKPSALEKDILHFVATFE